VTIYKLGDVAPTIHESAFIADTAVVIGHVVLAENTSVWFNATLRGDNESIMIGTASNIQDNAVLHTDPGCPLVVASHTTIGHQAMLHGCTVGSGSLIGIQAIILNNAVIGRNSLVGAGALVTEGQTFPDHTLILGSPARAVRELTDEEIVRMHANTQRYALRRAIFKRQLVRIG